MLVPELKAAPSQFPDCCLTCRHFDNDFGTIGCFHPLVPRVLIDFASLCEDHERDNKLVIISTAPNACSDEEEWCLQFCKHAGIPLQNHLASEAALQVERRFPTKLWKEAISQGRNLSYHQWILSCQPRIAANNGEVTAIPLNT